MSGDFLDEVGRLFSLVERDVTYKEIEEGGSPAITIGVRTGDTYTLRGDAYYLLEDLSEMIARPGYAAPGLSLEGARTVLIGACSRSLREGNDSATAWLLEKLASTPERWTVIRPVNLTARDTPFVVGGARIQRGLPDGARDENNELLRADFPAFSISCDVEAWDRDAAILFADRVFLESIAVLQLADRSGQPLVGSAAVTVSEGQQIYSHTTHRSGSVLSAVTSAGELLGSLGALSAAAEKETQTEWERRTLAAAGGSPVSRVTSTRARWWPARRSGLRLHAFP